MSDATLKLLRQELKERGVEIIICETLFYILTILVAVTGNVFVLLAFYRNAELRTIPNYFIATLAMSDILLPLLCAPQSIAVVILGRWPFNQHVCQAQGYFVIFLACVSLQTLALTAINRFYRIVRRAQYQSVFSKQNAKIMIILSLVFASLEPLPYLLSGRHYVFHPGKLFCFQTTEISFANILVYVYVGVPTFTLSICYILVFKRLRVHQQNVQRNLQSSSYKDGISLRDIKTTQILFITVVGFLACWTPIAIIDTLDTFRGHATFPRQVYYIYLILGNLSGVINPLVYGVLNKNFREEYKKIIFFRRRRQRIEGMQDSTMKSNRMIAFV